MAEEQMPSGVTKLGTKDISALLQNLIEITKDKDYEEYLISMNEEMLAIQEKILKLEQGLTDNFEKSKSLGISDSSMSKIVQDIAPVLNSQIDKQNQLIGKTVASLKSPKTDIDKSKLEKENQDTLESLLESNEESIKIERKKFKDTKLGAGIHQQFGGVPEKALDQGIQTLLGPLQLITKPLEDFFKIDIGGSIKGGLKGIFGKKGKDKDTGVGEDQTEKFLSKKVRPKKNELLKAGIFGASSVYMVDELTNALKGSSKGSEGGILSKVKNSAVSGAIGGGAGTAVLGLGKKALAAAPMLALAGGLIWGVVDAISATLKAGDWGVSKVSAGIGGFIGGAGDGGIKSAFKGMGKWALIGAGIGSVVPVVGTLVGGLVGAAFGGIMGFIGGEKIAKGLDAVGLFFKNGFNLVVDGITTLFEPLFSGITDTITNIKNIWGDSETSLFDKVITTVKEVLFGIVNIPVNFIKSELLGLDAAIISVLSPEMTAKYEELKTQVKEWFGLLISPIVGGVVGIFTGWKEKLGNIKNIWGDDELTFFEKLKLSGKEILLGLINTPIDYLKGAVTKLFDNEKGKEVTSAITDWFAQVKKSITDWLGNLLPPWAKKIVNKVKGALDPTQEGGSVVGKVADKVIDGARKVAGKAGTFLKNIVGIEDGIVFSNGKVVRTSPDDNIIATKSKPIVETKNSFSLPKENILKDRKDSQSIRKEIENNYFKSNVDNESIKRFDTMIMVLKDINSKIQNKKATVINTGSNSSSIDFDSLRIGV